MFSEYLKYVTETTTQNFEHVPLAITCNSWIWCTHR